MKQVFFRTDLAIEMQQWMTERDGQAPDGVKVRTKVGEFVQATEVSILTTQAEEAMGRKRGRYVTLEAPLLRQNHTECLEETGALLEEVLQDFLALERRETVLVVGLGNRFVTADALGPKVVEGIFVPRHLKDALPPELQGAVRPMAAIAPGVMGITGIETGETIRGVVEKIRPSRILVVDALAARKFSRVNATIQISDTGICPGSGVGNRRMELSRRTLGVPVIAIGVPTVVDAATLVWDALHLAGVKEGEGKEAAEEVLLPYAADLFVTPREMDAALQRLSSTIAAAVNAAVHPKFRRQDQGRYFY